MSDLNNGSAVSNLTNTPPQASAPAAATNTPPAAAAAPAPAAASTEWFGSMAEENKGLVQKKNWKNAEDAVTSYRNLEKIVGVPENQVVRLPQKDDDAEGWGSVYSKLGKPAKAEEYKLSFEGSTPETLKAIQDAYHGANLTQKQAEALTKTSIEMSKQAKIAEENNLRAAGEKTLTDLKTEWGMAYEQNVRLIDMAAGQLGLNNDHLVALRKAMGPTEATKFVYGLAKSLGGEDKFVSGDKGSPLGAMTPSAAKARVQDLKNDSAWLSKWRNGDVEAKKELDRLHQFMNPA